MKVRFVPALRRRAAGVGIITAVFLVVVLAALAVALVSVFRAQQSTAVLDEQGARAYQAARAGIEWGLFKRLSANSCSAVTSFALPADSSLAGFTVTVTCTNIGANGDPLQRTIIVATACAPSNGSCPSATANPDYVQRRLEVEL